MPRPLTGITYRRNGMGFSYRVAGAQPVGAACQPPA